MWNKIKAIWLIFVGRNFKHLDEIFISISIPLHSTLFKFTVLREILSWLVLSL